MLESTERCRDRRVAALEAGDGREIVVEAALTEPRVADGKDALRTPHAFEVPQREVEEVDRFLQDPGPDLLRRESPVAGTLSEAVPKQVDANVLQLAQLAG